MVAIACHSIASVCHHLVEVLAALQWFESASTRKDSDLGWASADDLTASLVETYSRGLSTTTHKNSTRNQLIGKHILE